MSDRAAWERHPGIEGIAGMLLGIHDSFRETSAALVSLEDGEDLVPRARRLFRPLASTLHHHHHAEEVMLFPLIGERTGEHPQDLVDDHGTLMARLDEVEVCLERADRERLPGLLVTLDAELRDHLDREEALAVPVLLELSASEMYRLLTGL